MGLLATPAIRLQELQRREMELQYKILLITEACSNLSTSAEELMQTGTDMDEKSPIMARLRQRKDRINSLEKKLQSQKQQLQIRLQMVQAEMQSAQQMFERSLQSAFRY